MRVPSSCSSFRVVCSLVALVVVLNNVDVSYSLVPKEPRRRTTMTTTSTTSTTPRMKTTSVAARKPTSSKTRTTRTTTTGNGNDDWDGKKGLLKAAISPNSSSSSTASSFSSFSFEAFLDWIATTATTTRDAVSSLVVEQEESSSTSGIASSSHVNRVASQLNISFAAASVTAAFIFLITHHIVPSCFALAVVYIISRQDPYDENTMASQLAKLLGRSSLVLEPMQEQSMQPQEPSMPVQAQAQQQQPSETLLALEQRIQELEHEKDALQQWKDEKLFMENNISKYSIQELKAMLSSHNMSVDDLDVDFTKNKKGKKQTKMELLARLVQAGIIDPTM